MGRAKLSGRCESWWAAINQNGAILRELISLASCPGGPASSERESEDRNKSLRCPFSGAKLRVLPSCLPHSMPTAPSPPQSYKAISEALPTNLATRQRAVSLNHLQLWQTQRGKTFLLSDETGSCSFFFRQRQSAPSVSRSQLAPDVHHTMARRFSGEPGRDGRTVSGIFARMNSAARRSSGTLELK